MKKNNLLFLLCTLVVCSSVFCSVEQVFSASFKRETSLPGFTYRIVELLQNDPALCQKKCDADAKCKAWTYAEPAVRGRKSICWLKYGIPSPDHNPCCVSGIKDTDIPSIQVQMAAAEAQQMAAAEAQQMAAAEAQQMAAAEAQQGEAEQAQQMQRASRMPTAHVWEYFENFGAEPKGYATYSYLLAGRNGSEKYAELVKIIQESTAEARDVAESNMLSPDELNIFMIPAVNTDSAKNRPDMKFSKELLAVLSARSPLDFNRPGPYVITMYQPISSLKKGAAVVDLLYVDLTNIHQGAVAEVVRVYKQAVLSERLTGIDKLHSLRLSLLNLAFIAEDSIGFAKTASASLDPIFSGSSN